MKVARDMLLLAAAALRHGDYDEAGKFFQSAINDEHWPELAAVIADCCDEPPPSTARYGGPERCTVKDPRQDNTYMVSAEGAPNQIDMGYPKQFGLIGTTSVSPVKVKGPKNEPSGGDPDYNFFDQQVVDLSLDREERLPLGTHFQRTVQRAPKGF